MEDWFRRKSYLPRDSKLLLEENLTAGGNYRKNIRARYDKFLEQNRRNSPGFTVILIPGRCCAAEIALDEVTEARINADETMSYKSQLFYPAVTSA